MAQSFTLIELRAAAFRRADLTDTNFITTAEANEYVNAGIAELHDLLVTKYEDYFQETATITLVAGTEAYALPTEFQKLLAIYYLSNGKRYRLERFNLDDLADYDRVTEALDYEGKALRYRIVGGNVYVDPNPTTGGTLEVWFVPQSTTLSDDDDPLSVTFVSGWEEFVIIDAAIQMLTKEESDTQALYARKAALKDRIIRASGNRDAFRPSRVKNTQGYRTRRRLKWR